MYYTLPPVIAELVSNSYDADASTVTIKLNDIGEKHIQVIDNGHGMSFKEINSKFLRIGRNRRVQTGQQKSESGNRFVIGKKGIGKLSFFGIAHLIIVETIRDGLMNKFTLSWEKTYRFTRELRARNKH
jgi:HSP90 family molecular chaperone